MSLAEYIGSIEFPMIQFIFSTIDEIKEKISKKKLFYREQIIRYIRRKIDHFFKRFTIKKALLQTYKNDTFNTIMFKLRDTLKDQIIFRCA